MAVCVRLPQPLRVYADGEATVSVDNAATLGEAFAALESTWPAIARRITDEQGCVRRHLMVFVGEDRVYDLDAALPDGAEVSIIPAVSGG
jgi:sulfur-carrier protein